MICKNVFDKRLHPTFPSTFAPEIWWTALLRAIQQIPSPDNKKPD